MAWEADVLWDIRAMAETDDMEDGSWWDQWAWDIWQDRDKLYEGAAIKRVSFIRFRAAVRSAVRRVMKEAV
jgi:hypothetical protein